ncbi:MAG: thioredoxin family protein [Planctomycetota bacterium]
MVTQELLKTTFAEGLEYAEYVRTGSPAQVDAWGSNEARVALTDAQRSLIGGFEREVNVLVSSGMWCGDCAQQGPIFPALAAANPEKVRVRFVDRDEHSDLSELIKISDGLRVPTAIFLNEDFDFIDLVGDATLSRYRAKAARNLGAACPLPGAAVDADEMAATVQDWVDILERVHLLNRLSPKLRQRHGD